MKHSKIATVALLAIALLVGLPLAAQTTAAPAPTTTSPAATTATASPTPAPPATVGAPNAAEIGVDTAQQKLKEVSVDKFEEEGFWYPTMSSDAGFISARLFLGGPAGKANDPLPDERLINNNNQVADTHVLGVKVEYLHRGATTFEVRAAKPIPIEGITKTISVWVVGRNYDNVLEILVSDFFGREYALPMGTLNFQGWKKMTIAIPPQSADGMTGIVQRNFHYATNMGIKVVGFRVICDPMQAYGSYYIYFDDMRAVTDLFAEDNRDPDDMSDAW